MFIYNITLGHFSLALWIVDNNSKWRHGPIRLLISVHRNLVELVPLPRLITYYHHLKPPRFKLNDQGVTLKYCSLVD
jgi:hypothetical protein